VKDWLETIFFGLGVLDRDPEASNSRGPRTLAGDALVGDTVALRLLMVPETLPSRSLCSVDFRISDKVESVDRCLPLCLSGVVGADRIGLAGGLMTGFGIFDASYTYPMVTDGLTTRLSLLAPKAGLGISGSTLESPLSWA
jgi:hypothetical protein